MVVLVRHEQRPAPIRLAQMALQYRLQIRGGTVALSSAEGGHIRCKGTLASNVPTFYN